MTKAKQKIVAPEAEAVAHVHRFHAENPEHGTQVCIDCGAEKKPSEMTMTELLMPPMLPDWPLDVSATPTPPNAPPGTRAYRDAQVAANG